MSKCWKFKKIANLKWSSYFIFVLYGSTNGGVDTQIKILQCCISKLQAFANIVAGYPIATTQNCIYFEIGMRYLHNFCFYTPIFNLREHKYAAIAAIRVPFMGHGYTEWHFFKSFLEFFCGLNLLPRGLMSTKKYF